VGGSATASTSPSPRKNINNNYDIPSSTSKRSTRQNTPRSRTPTQAYFLSPPATRHPVPRRPKSYTSLLSAHLPYSKPNLYPHRSPTSSSSHAPIPKHKSKIRTRCKPTLPTLPPLLPPPPPSTLLIRVTLPITTVIYTGLLPTALMRALRG
jgi:hypothetical protein